MYAHFSVTFAYHVQLTGQVRSATVLSLALVSSMVLKEGTFALQGAADGLFLLNITLTTVDNRDVAKAEWDNTTSQNIHNISTGIPI